MTTRSFPSDSSLLSKDVLDGLLDSDPAIRWQVLRDLRVLKWAARFASLRPDEKFLSLLAGRDTGVGQDRHSPHPALISQN